MKCYKQIQYYFNYISCNDFYSYWDLTYSTPASKGSIKLQTKTVVSIQEHSLYLPSAFPLFNPLFSTIPLNCCPHFLPLLTDLLSTFISQDINLIHPSVIYIYTYSLFLSILQYPFIVHSRTLKISHLKLRSNACWTDWFSDKILWNRTQYL